MINCQIRSLSTLGSQLRLYQIILGELPVTADGPQSRPSNEFIEQIKGWLKVANTVADEFELTSVKSYLPAFERRLRQPSITNEKISNDAGVLLELLDENLKGQLVYRYPSDKAKILRQWKEDWAPAVASFPSAAADIRNGVDLWALGHGTASVFHFMRVLEHGLRALANDVGKSFDVQSWQVVIDQIEAEVRSLGKTLPAGKEKSSRLKFLSEAAKEFAFFKDGWRNHVAHGRENYDDHQARNIMDHVRHFMTLLSSGLSEDGPPR
ncbi:hypothetical protein [Bosea caraganae]|uniref:hypothetical protein n=1 Tax=Bosea caraganae TaxID=2763117 RepID=UPI0011C02A4C|nr:hypothetical protein [Bosea caraganae]